MILANISASVKDTGANNLHMLHFGTKELGANVIKLTINKTTCDRTSPLPMRTDVNPVPSRAACVSTIFLRAMKHSVNYHCTPSVLGTWWVLSWKHRMPPRSTTSGFTATAPLSTAPLK